MGDSYGYEDSRESYALLVDITEETAVDVGEREFLIHPEYIHRELTDNPPLKLHYD